MHLKGLVSLLLALASVHTTLSLTVSPEQNVISSNSETLDSIRRTLKAAAIIKDVVDDFTPKCFLIPIYQYEKHGSRRARAVTLGNVFKTTKTKHMPALRIYCPGMSETKGLTVALTDPDAPSRKDPKWAEMCHWIGIVYTPEDGAGFDAEVAVDELEQLVECKRYFQIMMWD